MPRAEQLAEGLDVAESEAALTGRSLTDTACELDVVGRRVGGVGATRWEGRAGTEARRRVEDARVESETLAMHCLFLADVLRVEGEAVVRAARQVEAAGPSGGELAGTTAAAALADADRALTVRLTEAADALAGSTDPATQPCLDLERSTGGDPREVAELWHSLDPAERQRLLWDHPDLGSQAGLPAASRDAINRTRLTRVLDAAAAPGSSARGGVTVGPDALAQLEALSAHLDADPRRNLLMLDLGAPGADGGGAPAPRAVVASADPDSAERVVTLVPGTGSSLAGLGRTSERAQALCEVAEDAATEACVSVSWQGYEAPTNVLSAGVFTDPATAHAPDLRDHAAGLDAVDRLDGHDSPHAVVGYSYGSAVVGAAASSPQGLAADRMVHVGSAGATVDSIAEQWVDDGGTPRPARHDDVVGVTSRWDPVPWWSVTGVLGGVPGSENFGGIAVDVTEPVDGLGDMGEVHSDYFDPGTVSLEEIRRHLFPR